MRGVNTVLSGLKEEMVGKILESLSKRQKTKALNFVDNWDLLKIAAVGERARTGQPLSEPWGSTMDFPSFRGLVFLPAHLQPFPLLQEEEVDISTTIGPNATHPLTVSMPVFITGMGYGVSLSQAARIALARGSARGSTAISSGEGGFVPVERQESNRYIVQYTRGRFSSNPADLANVDMVEVKLGQGASASTGFTASIEDYEFKTHLSLREEESDAEMPARFPDIMDLQGIKAMVDELREVTSGVPIGLKIAAGHIEKDLELGLEAGFDVFILDGAEGGTYESLEITINNFGIPTLYAVPRAHNYLNKVGKRDQVSLIAAGGMRTSGDFLKALALGADAVYVGSAVLIAMSYSQWNKLPAGATPGDLFFYGGKHTNLMDVEEGAQGVGNFLLATGEELAAALRTMGKRSLGEISKDDLQALDPLTADITGVSPAY